MFKRKFIRQVTATTSGQMLFTLGLGRDGKMYSWDAMACQWVLFKQIMPPAEAPQEQK